MQMTDTNQKLREALQVSLDYLEQNSPANGWGLIDHDTNKERMDAMFLIRDALALPTTQAQEPAKHGDEAEYWGSLAQQKADADKARGVSMPVSYYASSVVGALLASQQFTIRARWPDDIEVYLDVKEVHSIGYGKIGIDVDVPTVHPLADQSAAQPQAQDHFPDATKMIETAVPVGERDAFEQIVMHRIGSRAIERWSDDSDAEYKNSQVEDLRGGWLMHLQWQARAAMRKGQA